MIKHTKFSTVSPLILRGERRAMKITEITTFDPLYLQGEVLARSSFGVKAFGFHFRKS